MASDRDPGKTVHVARVKNHLIFSVVRFFHLEQGIAGFGFLQAQTAKPLSRGRPQPGFQTRSSAIHLWLVAPGLSGD